MSSIWDQIKSIFLSPHSPSPNPELQIRQPSSVQLPIANPTPETVQPIVNTKIEPNQPHNEFSQIDLLIGYLLNPDKPCSTKMDELGHMSIDNLLVQSVTFGDDLNRKAYEIRPSK